MFNNVLGFLLLILSVSGQDDAGADIDMESMAGGEAGSVNEESLDEMQEEKTLIQQTFLAIQQLSIIIGEFFLNISSGKVGFLIQ